MKNKCTVLFFFFVLVCFLTACSGNGSQNSSASTNPSAPQRITAETARRMMQESSGFVLLDVRTPAEFRGRRIAGAVLIPHTEIERRAPSELPDKNAVIFVYCQAGVRSANAARTLAELGYTQVFDFGGIADWRFETVSGTGVDYAAESTTPP